MAELKKDPVKQETIRQYLSENSDFAFEMKVVELLRGLRFDVEHSGSYFDPITAKPRQFDIRAKKAFSQKRLFLAVECKAISEYFPLVTHSTRRKSPESFHDVLVRPVENVYLKTVSRSRLYPEGGWVGKSSDQVGIDTNNKIKSYDREVFEKTFQAISSSRDLIEEGYKTSAKGGFTTVIPILVIPDSRLWDVRYKDEGTIEEGPIRTPHVQFYHDHSWEISDSPSKEYRISHLEIIEISSLKDVLNKIFSEEENRWADLFPMDQLQSN